LSADFLLNRLGDRLKYCRIKSGFSFSKIQDKTGYSKSTIIRWETHSSLRNMDKIQTLAETYNVSVAWLAYFQGHRKHKVDKSKIERLLDRRVAIASPRRKRLYLDLVTGVDEEIEAYNNDDD